MLICLASGICQQGPGIGPMDSGAFQRAPAQNSQSGWVNGGMGGWEGSGSKLGPSGLEAKT